MASKPTGNEHEKRRARWQLQDFAVALIVVLGIGFSTDMFSGFELIRKAPSVAIAVVGLSLLGVMYLIGEALVSWLSSRISPGSTWIRRIARISILTVVVAALFIFLVGLLRLFGVLE